MITENTKLARLIAEVLRLSDDDVESDERWAGVAELRQLDPEQIFEIAAELCAGRLPVQRELGADLLGSGEILGNMRRDTKPINSGRCPSPTSPRSPTG
jgi:hypothetical protein